MADNVIMLYAGMPLEIEELKRTAKQVGKSLDSLGYKYNNISAYEYPPDDWGDAFFKDSKVLLLDPYYIQGDVFVDLREYLNKYNVPYTGPSIKSTTITRDKQYTKDFLDSKYLFASDIFTIPGALCNTYTEVIAFMNKDPHSTTGEYVLKPHDRGNGCDIKVINPSALDEQIIHDLLKKYSTVLIEPYIDNFEVSIPIINSPKHNAPIALSPISINLKGHKVFDFNIKMNLELCEVNIPAKISKRQCKLLSEHAVRIYNALSFNGLLRVDYLLARDHVYFLEANSFPSLNNASFTVPSIIAAGYTIEDAIEWLLLGAGSYQQRRADESFK